MPSQVSALGITVGARQSDYLYYFLAGVVGYFWVAFFFMARTEMMVWRTDLAIAVADYHPDSSDTDHPFRLIGKVNTVLELWFPLVLGFLVLGLLLYAQTPVQEPEVVEPVEVTAAPLPGQTPR